MKFGVNTFIWAAGVDGDLLKLLPSIKQHGFDGVEFPLIRPAQLPVPGSAGASRRIISNAPSAPSSPRS